MNGPYMLSENRKFTLDYNCVDGCALKYVERAYIIRNRGSSGE